MTGYERIAEVPGVALQRAENDPLQTFTNDVSLALPVIRGITDMLTALHQHDIRCMLT